MNNNLQILDVCCGSRMFWFDKTNPAAIFLDNRHESHVLNDSSKKSGTRTLFIEPDMIADFTALPFDDESFAMVVFDPPHLVKCGDTGWQAKKYGKLRGDWQSEIAKGFEECFRVLRPLGTLIFKWNEIDISVAQIISLAVRKPLFGNRCGKTAKTHWIVWMKN